MYLVYLYIYIHSYRASLQSGVPLEPLSISKMSFKGACFNTGQPWLPRNTKTLPLDASFVVWATKYIQVQSTKVNDDPCEFQQVWHFNQPSPGPQWQDLLTKHKDWTSGFRICWGCWTIKKENKMQHTPSIQQPKPGTKHSWPMFM